MQDICNILGHASGQDKRLTFPKLLDIWFGKGEKKLRPDNLVVCRHPREVAQQIIGFLLIDRYLKEEFHFTPYSTISYVAIGPAWLTRTTQQLTYWLSKESPGGKAVKKKSTKRKSPDEENWDIITLD